MYYDNLPSKLVSDSGYGIDAIHLPNVCNRLYRIPSSSNAQSQGLSLGLSMVKSIMDLHQSSLTIESTLSQGTQVSLFFP